MLVPDAIATNTPFPYAIFDQVVELVKDEVLHPKPFALLTIIVCDPLAIAIQYPFPYAIPVQDCDRGNAKLVHVWPSELPAAVWPVLGKAIQ